MLPFKSKLSETEAGMCAGERVFPLSHSVVVFGTMSEVIEIRRLLSQLSQPQIPISVQWEWNLGKRGAGTFQI